MWPIQPAREWVHRRRRDAQVLAALPDLLERVAGDLRAGAAPLVALTGASGGADLPAPLAADLANVVRRAGDGGLRPALADWAEERPMAAVSAVAAALDVTLGAGGPAAPALEGLAAGLRDRQDAAGEVAALSAQARLSAVVVGAAPLVSLGLSLLADRRVAPTLVATASGRTCLLVGTAVDGLAMLWMRRIVRCEP